MQYTRLPSDRAGRLAWLALQQERIAGRTRRELRGLVARLGGRYVESLTAAGDLAVFDGLPAEWVRIVDGIVAELGQIHATAAMAAYRLALDHAAAVSRPVIESVVNEAAVSYMAQASNRLVGVGDDMWRRIRSNIQTGVSQGATNEELKARIEGLTQFSEFRADTIARTETNGAYVNGDRAAVAALGADGPTEKVWVAALDDRTRESHAAAHDQCVPVDQPFDVGGVRMDGPFDPGAPAEEVVNCRCIVEYLYPGDTRPDGSTVPDVPGDGEPGDG